LQRGLSRRLLFAGIIAGLQRDHGALATAASDCRHERCNWDVAGEEDFAIAAAEHSLLQVQMRVRSARVVQAPNSNSLLQLTADLQVPVPNTSLVDLQPVFTVNGAPVAAQLPERDPNWNPSIPPLAMASLPSQASKCLAQILRAAKKLLANEEASGHARVESFADLDLEDAFNAGMCLLIVLPMVLVFALAILMRSPRRLHEEKSMGNGLPMQHLEVPDCWADMPRRPGCGWGQPQPVLLAVAPPNVTSVAPLPVREAN